MKKTLLVLSVLVALTAQANEKQNEHKHDHAHSHDNEKVAPIGAHVHGEAQMNVLLEGKNLLVMLDSPAMNIIGFEHKPETEAHLEQSHEALHLLGDTDKADKLLTVVGGDCRLQKTDVDWEYAEQVHNHFHGDDKHDEHKHDEHKHDEHKHDDGEEHSDVETQFAFVCQSAAVKSITVNLFDAFPGLEKLDVQWIVGEKQGAQTLNKESRELKLQ